MARGRIIDKDIFSHEILGDMSLTCRYLYQGLIVFADDEGRLKCHPKYLKAKIFPYDDVAEKDVKAMIELLSKSGLLLVYQVGDSQFIEHPKWAKWQPIRKDRFKPSDCPSSVDGVPLVDQEVTTPTPLPNLTKPNLIKELGVEVSPTPSPPAPPFLVFKTNGKTKEWFLTGRRLLQLKELYPGVEVERECRLAADWCEREPQKRKTANGMERFLNTWLSKEQNKFNGTKPMGGSWDRVNLQTLKKS